MSEEAAQQDAPVVPSPMEEPVARPEVPAVEERSMTNGETQISEPKEEGTATDPVPEPAAPAPTIETKEPESANDKQPITDASQQDKPATTQEDIEMKDDINPADAAPAADDSVDGAASTPASGSKSKARRKSSGIPEHKNKKLNKKASKAKMSHTDAKPGDYFFVRLKGYPLWPAIVCDESMLPTTLIDTRPVTAADEHGVYRADFADGGNKVKDRTFPVMYLHTNEFGWIPNYDLLDLDFETVGNVSSNMRKDLHAAHELAAEKHDLEYFKDILANFMEARKAELEAKEQARLARNASKAKRKSKVAVGGEAGQDVEMADALAEADSGVEADGTTTEKPKKKSNKRKAEEEAATPGRSDSVKKPRPTIKLNTPKTTNGAAAPKTPKDPSATKSAKPKAKKSAPKVKEPEVVTPKEPELTAEEKRQKKEKEILFLRHKLQKGLLTKDQEPKEEEMKAMSEFVTKLEGYADLEVAIIRATKINKVLKAILKLATIPKEEEFQFKPRSQTLLDKWNKLLSGEQIAPIAPSPATTNGVEAAKQDFEVSKGVSVAASETTNGIKDNASEGNVENKVEEKALEVEALAAAPAAESKNAPTTEGAPIPSEKPAKEHISEPSPVESTA